MSKVFCDCTEQMVDVHQCGGCKMFDYISGKAQGREAELEATLEHVMAYCVPLPEYEKVCDQNKRLKAALKEIKSWRTQTRFAAQQIARKALT